MKSGNTVILPLKEKRINPITGKEEIMDTGAVAEFSQGKQVSAPFRMPRFANVEQERAARLSAMQAEETLAVSLYSGDTRNLAEHYQRPGETTVQAAERLADSASRFEVSGNRAEAAAAPSSPAGRGYHQSETISASDPRAYANGTN